jgi:vancomycin resistance protein VanJ
MSFVSVPEPNASSRRRFRWASLRAWFGAWLRRLVVVSAILYPVCLLALALALRIIGEAWWVTTLGLYVPQLPFALPLPFLAAALWAYRLRRLLLSQLVSVVALLYLVGFVMPVPTWGRGGEPRLRVLSFNVDSGYAGYDTITAQIEKHSPDIVLVQEAFQGPEHLAEMLGARYPHVGHSTQFVIASRFPILKTTDPERLPYFGRQRSPRFMRYLIATPFGEIAFYSVHPASPRGVLRVHRWRYALHMLRTGELFSGDPEADVEGNAGLRILQLETVAKMAEGEPHAVVIAGDFNMPALSPAFHRAMSGYQDGFGKASWGLGYTFPSKHPWLRLDRILASDSLKFTAFEVGCPGLSDHRCVVADIERR